jgi:hypothetical protein
MRGGTLKSHSLVFERKGIRSGGVNSDVLEMNHSPLSGKQNGHRQTEGDQA